MKRIFNIIDEMCKQDEENGTKTVLICPTMIEADFKKEDTAIQMCAPGNQIERLVSGEVVPILLLVDRDKYIERT